MLLINSYYPKMGTFNIDVNLGLFQTKTNEHGKKDR